MYRLEEWYVVKNYREFIMAIECNRMPKRISFDHDLGDLVLHKTIDENGEINYDAIEFKPLLQKTGWHCAKWWIDNYYLKEGFHDVEIFVHSENQQGKENIKKLFDF